MGSMKLMSLFLAACMAAQVLHAEANVAQLICPAPSPEQAKAGGTAKKISALHKRLQTIEKSGINATDSKGQTALMTAAALNQRLAVCYLIARGAEIDTADKDKKTAPMYTRSAALRELMNVCRGSGGSSGPAIPHEEVERKAQLEGLGDPEERRARLWQLVATPGHFQQIQELIRIDVETSGTGPDGKTLLQVPGICPEYIAYFVRRGYNLQAKGKDGSGLLRADMPAPTARLLLALGLKPDAADSRACMLAALFGDDTKEVKRLLKEHADLLSQMDAEHSLLALAQSGSMVRLLAEADAKMPEMSSLLARTGEDPRDASVIRALLELGAPVKKGALLTLCSLGSADAGIAQLLLNDEDKDMANDAGTALHHAAARGCAATVKVLLAGGLSPNQTNAAGDTPLHHLLKNPGKSTPEDQVDTVKALVKGGASTKAKNKEGQSALQLAKAQGREDLLKAMKGSK